MVATTRRLDYERIKREAAARRRDASRLGRDIGAIPPIVDPGLRRACQQSLRVFCERMFPQRFSLAWGKNHLRVIELMQDTIRNTGRVAVAMPRGEGKTTLAECAGGLWATLNGIHRFVVIIGAAKPNADSILENIQTELSTNEQLLATYPGVCYPFWCLQGEARRANGQLHHGQRTHIVWSQNEVRFGMIPGEPASGTIIQTAGIEGNIRGRSVQLPSGEKIRPTLAILDDVQTDESAWSETQCESRGRVIEGAVAGLSGAGHEVSMIMPCTVIRRGDLADKILDRSVSPQWRGIRTRMVEKFPTNDTLWAEYAELRVKSLVEREDISLATEFYRRNRAKMDAGAVVAWEERYNRKTELSAIQHAMNLKLADEAAFWAEYQNEPLDDSAGSETQLTTAQIMAKVNGYAHRQIPTEAEHLTAFIDVQGKVLYYLVAAWSPSFEGWVVDYGAFPDQRRRYFTLRDVKRTLAHHAPKVGQEAQLYAGLKDLTDELCGREWQREDDAPMRLGLALIDANWGPSTEVVYKVCRASEHAAVLRPSHGRYYGASSKPLAERAKKKGERVGLNWYLAAGKSQVRHVVWDTNWWKSFLHARLRVPMGDPSGLSLYGTKPEDHRMLAEHLTSEQGILTEGRGRKVEEFKLKRAGLDNHLFDGAVGCAVAASMLGASLADQEQPSARKRRRVSLAEMRGR